MAEGNRVVTVGVDTHKDAHVAAALGTSGALLGTASFPADARLRLDGRVDARLRARRGGRRRGHGRLQRQARPRSTPQASACSRSRRPTAPQRRRRGKSDGIDAEQARAALAGTRCAPPKSRCAEMGALGALGGLRRRPVKARTAALNAPCGPGRRCPRRRGPAARQGLPRAGPAPAPHAPRRGLLAETLAEVALRSLARQARMLDEEARRQSRDRRAHEGARPSTSRSSRQAHVAARLLLAAGASVSRLRSEASFSMLCGASPAPVSSGGRSAPPEPRGRRARPLGALHHGDRPQLRQADRSYVARRMSRGQDEEGRHPLPQALHRLRGPTALAQDMEAPGMS